MYWPVATLRTGGSHHVWLWQQTNCSFGLNYHSSYTKCAVILPQALRNKGRIAQKWHNFQWCRSQEHPTFRDVSRCYLLASPKEICVKISLNQSFIHLQSYCLRSVQLPSDSCSEHAEWETLNLLSQFDDAKRSVWRKLPNKDLPNVYSWLNITRMIKVDEDNMGDACNAIVKKW